MKPKKLKESIGMKGDRALWFDFVAAVKKQGKDVWNVLEPFIRDYIKRKK